MNGNKKKIVFVLWCFFIVMTAYYNKRNVNFTELNVPKANMKTLESSKFPDEVYKVKTISEQLICGENAIELLFSENGEKKAYDSRHIYKDDAGNVLEYDITSLTYSTAFYQKMSNTIFEENIKMCTDENELSFASKADIQEKINTVLKYMKIPIENLDYSCYVVPNSAIEERATFSSSNKEGSGYYFFSIRQQVNGNPVITKFLNTYISLTPSTAPIQILYSSEGIEYMHISELYNISTDVSSEKLVPFEQISKNVVYKYGQLINSSNYKMENVEFGYFILDKGNKKELIPVWVILIIETAKGREYEYQELYNALTGEEIVL